KDTPVNKVLQLVFEDQPLGYELMKETILVKARPSPKRQDPVALADTLRGKVTDTLGVPLPGVSVAVKGTSQGTVTDLDGQYVLENVPDNAILVFSLLGFSVEEVSSEGKLTVNAVMRVEEAQLDE